LKKKYEYKYAYYSEIEECWLITEDYYSDIPKFSHICKDLHRLENTKRIKTNPTPAEKLGLKCYSITDLGNNKWKIDDEIIYAPNENTAIKRYKEKYE